MTDPRTRKQWGDAADAAQFLLGLDSARRYGLVTGGPTIDVDRCVEIIEEAHRRKIRRVCEHCQHALRLDRGTWTHVRVGYTGLRRCNGKASSASPSDTELIARLPDDLVAQFSEIFYSQGVLDLDSVAASEPSPVS